MEKLHVPRLKSISQYTVTLVVVFIWIGFICSISFMEAWLKFRPENVTLPIGLSIGRLVFSALNGMEWAFASLIIISAAFFYKKVEFKYYAYFCIPLFLLIFQTFVLLPPLNERVELVLQGKELPSSLLHVYYVSAELIKVISLFVFGIKILRAPFQHGICSEKPFSG